MARRKTNPRKASQDRYVIVTVFDGEERLDRLVLIWEKTLKEWESMLSDGLFVGVIPTPNPNDRYVVEKIKKVFFDAGNALSYAEQNEVEVNHRSLRKLPKEEGYYVEVDPSRLKRNPRRNNPASSLGSIALAGLAGFLLGKK